MNPLEYKKAVQQSVAPKFKGKQELKSKVTPHYPESAEREYKRLMKDFMGMYDGILRRHMPELKRSLGHYGSARMDEETRTPDEIFNEIEQQLDKKLLSYDLRKRLERIANITRKLTIAEWKRVCQRTLGIDIFEDYYNGDFFKKAVDDWVFTNVDLIVTQPKNSLGKMREIVRESWAEGRRVESITKDINAEYQMSKSHARLIARDQMSKLNGDITRQQQEDAGVTMYIWDTSRDQRVRKTHRRMQGLFCRWDNVNVYSDDGGKTWKPKTADMASVKGKFVHVQQDYQCRCVSVPVFNIEGIAEIPVKSVDWKAVDKRYQDRLEAMSKK